MPKPYPSEFREDGVRVARRREPGVTLEQVAADFGVHPMTLYKGSAARLGDRWCQAATVRDANAPGRSRPATGFRCQRTHAVPDSAIRPQVVAEVTPRSGGVDEQ